MRILLLVSFIAGATAHAAAPPQGDTRDYRFIARLGGGRISHPNGVSVHPSPDGKMVATLESNGSVLFWSAREPRLLSRWESRARPSGAHWLPDGSAFAFLDAHKASALDPRTGKPLREAALRGSSHAAAWAKEGPVGVAINSVASRVALADGSAKSMDNPDLDSGNTGLSAWHLSADGGAFL
ncbi:MAG: hypothetical protein K2W96_15615 [Gemmataceae bacterium]|nr:hypothetical protein [Gemmataceae bacterium]